MQWRSRYKVLPLLRGGIRLCQTYGSRDLVALWRVLAISDAFS